MKIDKDKIKELTNYLDELGLSELEYGDKDLKIKVSKWQHAPSDNSSKKLEKNLMELLLMLRRLLIHLWQLGML